jgi:hypothetical protein
VTIGLRAELGQAKDHPFNGMEEMDLANVLKRLVLSRPRNRRSRRQLTPAVGLLEDRQLLATATMTQTATFPNLEQYPNVADQAFLYFSSTMGTLTAVDVVASGSYTTQFNAENTGASSSTITGTTDANLSINLPNGPLPLSIPSVTESFTAGPYDGTLNYSGTSGKEFATETSSAAPETTALTSPSDLAAFTGQFRIPVTISGHATGSASSTNGHLSDGFNTQTSVTLTIIYNYIPNMSGSTGSGGSSSSGTGSTSPTSGGSSSSGSSPTSTGPTTPIGTGSESQPVSTQSSSHGKKEKSAVSHKTVQHAAAGRVRPTAVHPNHIKAHAIAQKRK